MASFQLRGDDHVRVNPWIAADPRWHIAPVGESFALCRRLLLPSAPARPFLDAARIPDGHRCAACWEQARQSLSA